MFKLILSVIFSVSIPDIVVC